jgi:hypothetical protein
MEAMTIKTSKITVNLTELRCFRMIRSGKAMIDPLIPILVRNETYSILGSPPSLRLRSGQAQPSPIKGKGVLMIGLISIISNYRRYNNQQLLGKQMVGSG